MERLMDYPVRALLVLAFLLALTTCGNETPVGPQREQSGTTAIEANATTDMLFACYNPSGTVYRIGARAAR